MRLRPSANTAFSKAHTFPREEFSSVTRGEGTDMTPCLKLLFPYKNHNTGPATQKTTTKTTKTTTFELKKGTIFAIG
jgi:hypothetical protein